MAGAFIDGINRISAPFVGLASQDAQIKNMFIHPFLFLAVAGIAVINFGGTCFVYVLGVAVAILIGFSNTFENNDQDVGGMWVCMFIAIVMPVLNSLACIFAGGPIHLGDKTILAALVIFALLMLWLAMIGLPYLIQFVGECFMQCNLCRNKPERKKGNSTASMGKRSKWEWFRRDCQIMAFGMVAETALFLVLFIFGGEFFIRVVSIIPPAV